MFSIKPRKISCGTSKNFLKKHEFYKFDNFNKHSKCFQLNHENKLWYVLLRIF